jgi:archaellum component FlaG (FlaF/FlaG flagellin family)
VVVRTIFLGLVAVLLSLGAAYAQNVKVSASLRESVVTLSEQVQVDLAISAPKNPRVVAPAAPQVPGLSFRNVTSSTSSQTSIVNGKISRSYEVTFTYVYNPQKSGKFVIPGFKLAVDGKAYRTSDLRLEVIDVPAAPKSNQQYSQDPYYDPFGGSFFGRDRRDGESYLLCLTETQSVYLGEPAIIAYYLYTDQMVESFYTETEKDYPGYGKSNYEQPGNLEYESVQYKGRRFQRALIKKMALYPQTTGRLQAPTLTGTVQFSGFYSFLNRSLNSSAAWITVKALPAGKPEGFGGAVGSFTVTQSYSSNKVNLGEALTCSIRIAGRGNFSQFTAPGFPATDKFQVSEPVLQDKMSSAISGTRYIQYTLLPGQTGEFTLPGIVFSWFDTGAGQYRTFRGQSQPVRVRPANVLSYFSGLLDSGKPKKLNPLIAKSGYKDFQSFADQPWFWLILAACAVSLAVSGWLARERRLRFKDPSAYAQKTANRILGKYLRQATEAAGRLSKDFYPLAESGLVNYLSRKYGVSKGLSTGEMLEELGRKGVPAAVVGQLADFMQLCQKARYMPGGGEVENLDKALAGLRSLVQSFSRLKQDGSNHHPEPSTGTGEEG